jgi:hypothetical protein
MTDAMCASTYYHVPMVSLSCHHLLPRYASAPAQCWLQNQDDALEQATPRNKILRSDQQIEIKLPKNKLARKSKAVVGRS